MPDYPSIGPRRVRSEQAGMPLRGRNDIPPTRHHMRTRQILRRIFAAATLASVFAFASGCSKDDTLSPGFYRHSDNPTVYKVSADGPPCAVLNMAQLTAMGGLQSVHVVEPSVADRPGGEGARPVRLAIRLLPRRQHQRDLSPNGREGVHRPARARRDHAVLFTRGPDRDRDRRKLPAVTSCASSRDRRARGAGRLPELRGSRRRRRG
jgi:hypothetical protein